jgi:hypothetical protein
MVPIPTWLGLSFVATPAPERQLEGIAEGKATGIWKGYLAAADVRPRVLG